MGIGKRIKEARERLGLTQEELGALVGVTGSAITNYEKGTSHPKEPVMYGLIDALDVDANYLFQDCVKTTKAPSVSDEAMKLAKDFDTLDTWGQKQVRDVADNELARAGAQRLEIKADSLSQKYAAYEMPNVEKKDIAASTGIDILREATESGFTPKDQEDELP